MTDRVEFTEAERIEFNRRTDVALSVVPSFGRLIRQKEELDERSTQLRRRLGSGWLVAVFLGGGSLQYFQFGTEWRLGVGVWIVLVALWFYYRTGAEWERVQAAIRECQHRIEDREITWVGVGGNLRELWGLKRFEVIGNQVEWDLAEETLEAWWEDQKEGFYIRVCGFEKGMAMAEQHKEEMARVRSFRARRQTERSSP